VTAGKMYSDDFNREIQAKLAPNDPNYIRWKNFTLSMINGLNKIKNNRGKNYVFEKKGKINPDEVIILGANYDTLNHDAKTMKIDLEGKMPGADNNGTGVAALLTFAKLLSVIDTDKTIRLVFFDMEEFGFLGSKAYAEGLKNNSKEKILGFVNLVMLGNDSKNKDAAKKLGNMKLYMRSPDVDSIGSNLDLNLANQITALAKKNYTSVNFEAVANGMNSSSQVSFWEQKIPAIVFTQDWEQDFNPRYHGPDDFFETINFNTYFNSFRYIIFGVLCFNFGVVK
jgi:Zn-dependent M28 family amino/carboxypeptidase